MKTNEDFEKEKKDAEWLKWRFGCLDFREDAIAKTCLEKARLESEAIISQQREEMEQLERVIKQIPNPKSDSLLRLVPLMNEWENENRELLEKLRGSK